MHLKEAEGTEGDHDENNEDSDEHEGALELLALTPQNDLEVGEGRSSLTSFDLRHRQTNHYGNRGVQAAHFLGRQMES